MKTCRNCNTEITHPINVFCNSSCAAKYNNARKSQSTREKQKASVIATYRKKFPKRYKDPSIYRGQSKYIRNCVNYLLNVPKDKVLIEDVEILKEWIYHQYHILNLLPEQIAKQLECEHSDFGLFMDGVLKIRMKSIKEAFDHKFGELRNEKLCALYEELDATGQWNLEQYYKLSEFRFSPYTYSNMKGYDLLLKYKVYHPIHNKEGVVRDHMISRIYGFRNGINPLTIAHPANCELMLATDNSSKSGSNSLQLEELHGRISKWESA